MTAARRLVLRRRLLQAAAGIERQRLALADAKASRAVAQLGATATAAATAAAAVAVVVAAARRHAPSRGGRWPRWAALARRTAGLLLLLRRARPRRAP